MSLLLAELRYQYLPEGKYALKEYRKALRESVDWPDKTDRVAVDIKFYLNDSQLEQLREAERGGCIPLGQANSLESFLIAAFPLLDEDAAKEILAAAIARRLTQP